MTMDFGLPKVILTFKGKTQRLIRHNPTGIVLLVLKDDTKGEPVTTYTSMNDKKEAKKEAWTEKNAGFINLALSGGARKVLAYRLASTAQLADFLKTLAFVKFDYMAMPEATAEENKTLVTFIKDNRQSEKHPEINGTWKLVTHNAENANHDAVIDFFTKSVDEGEKHYTGQEYTAKMAGLIAGLSWMRSTTSYVVPEVTKASLFDDPEKEVNAGKLIFVFDGEKYRLGRGVNTLQELAEGQIKAMAKIRTREILDIIRDDIVTTFLDDYAGKVLNTYNNRMQFCANITHIYFKELAGTLLDPDYDNRADLDVEAIKEFMLTDGVEKDTLDKMSETQIRTYPTGDHLFVTANIKLLDAIEDLDMTVTI